MLIDLGVVECLTLNLSLGLAKDNYANSLCAFNRSRSHSPQNELLNGRDNPNLPTIYSG
jgi:hypothetical protein